MLYFASDIGRDAVATREIKANELICIYRGETSDQGTAEGLQYHYAATGEGCFIFYFVHKKKGGQPRKYAYVKLII